MSLLLSMSFTYKIKSIGHRLTLVELHILVDSSSLSTQRASPYVRNIYYIQRPIHAVRGGLTYVYSTDIDFHHLCNIQTGCSILLAHVQSRVQTTSTRPPRSFQLSSGYLQLSRTGDLEQVVTRLT